MPGGGSWTGSPGRRLPLLPKAEAAGAPQCSARKECSARKANGQPIFWSGGADAWGLAACQIVHRLQTGDDHVERDPALAGE